MNRHRSLVAVSAIVLGISALMSAAGPSEVADAVMKGDRAALRALLQQKADVNAPHVDGATALHWAVYRDDLDAADLLIRAGAKVDAPTAKASRPLTMACLYGNVVDDRTSWSRPAPTSSSAGPTARRCSCSRRGTASPRRSRLLVAAGADVNARETLRGTTALMWAAEQKHPAAVKALLDGGADFGAKSGPAGLPRNYMAGRVNAARVEAAVRRRARGRGCRPDLRGATDFEGVQRPVRCAGRLPARRRSRPVAAQGAARQGGACGSGARPRTPAPRAAGHGASRLRQPRTAAATAAATPSGGGQAPPASAGSPDDADDTEVDRRRPGRERRRRPDRARVRGA